jgi:hypothetical protein
MATPEWIAATLRVTAALDQLGVPYVIGGSVASIVHGEIRTTMDADLVADVRIEHIHPLMDLLADEFYVVEDAIRQAILARRSFNLIHRQSMFKVDIFLPKRRPFDRAQLNRRLERVVARDPDRTAWVATAEDTVLAKLEWYEMGGRVSDRQWRDVLGVLKARGAELDLSYMRQSAVSLNLSALLERALRDAGLS